MYEKMQEAASQIGERVLVTPKNPISIGLTLNTIAGKATEFGGILYSHGVSGMQWSREHLMR